MKRSTALRAPMFVVLLAACGGSDGSQEPATSAVNSAVAVESEFNDEDVMFAQMMIPHHEQAIEMAEIALDPTVGASDDVRDLATRIVAAQDPEIVTMTGLLEAWGKSITPEDGVDHGSMMKGMLSVQELDELASLTGSTFDARWAEAMIAHHEGAVAMAEEVLSGGLKPDARGLAEEIIATQEAEIDELAPIADS